MFFIDSLIESAISLILMGAGIAAVWVIGKTFWEEFLDRWFH